MKCAGESSTIPSLHLGNRRLRVAAMVFHVPSGLTQDRMPYLIVDFKFLNHPQLHEHPKGSRDHGINVERKVIKMYVIDGKF